jgi:8-oxo-dGTP diphosphatase
MTDLVLNVAAKIVVVNREGKVLIVRESTHDTNTQSGRYTLPGGRLGSGESFVDGLKREAMEEVGLEVEPGQPVYVGEWRPVIKGVPHQVIAIFVVCKARTTKIRLSEEHDGFEWIDPKHRKQYDLADPDWDVIDAYARTFKKSGS